MTAPYGIYVHVPWCRGICPYCGFFVRRADDAPYAAYVDAVLREHARRLPTFGAQPHTLYLGGGTPSRLPLAELQRLVANLPDVSHITVEANPEDIDRVWLSGILDVGVSRVSLGVQTTDTALARRLGRGHTAQVAHRAMAMVADSGLASWSADLIFGVPDQTLQQLDADLTALLDAGAPHISLYGLTIEPGTPFERATVAGRLTPLPDDLWRQMYEHLVSRLRAAGLHRYEVSNFARPGHQSAHNRLYWTDAPYMGLGPSAHGYDPTGARYENVRDVDAYLAQADPTGTSETPTGEQRAVDMLISMMRVPDGVPIGLLARRTGFVVRPSVVAALQEAGLLERTDGVLALSDSGFPVSDGVIARLATALIPH